MIFEVAEAALQAARDADAAVSRAAAALVGRAAALDSLGLNLKFCSIL